MGRPALLSDDQAARLRRCVMEGMTIRAAAERFGVSGKTVYRVLNGGERSRVRVDRSELNETQSRQLLLAGMRRATA